ncbi:Quinic acid utilization activator [Fusarium acutatum]|uniref:Quinic acid utilization activator n=1 Tax=Fusarium acutatum TaxID=78861 RepID=A0A8H4JGV9_9HYPO|nr:Quinic acid utilization activator [Fusarium acutatum]
MDPPAKPKRTRVNKHKRVSRACNYCRARKHRCDGTHPTCSRCSAIHYPCSYGPDTKKRGLTTGYVRALELLWALVFTVVPNSKAVIQELLPDVQFALDSRSRLVLNSRLVKDYDTLRQAWDGSDVQEELDQLLLNVQQGNDSGPNSVASIKNEVSTPDLAPRITAFEALQTAMPANDARQVSDPVDSNRVDAHSPHDASVSQSDPWNDVFSPASAQHVQRLIDIYFAHTNCWLPVVHKHKMLELLYSPSRDDAAEEGNMATLWAVIAYASLQDTRNTTGASDGRADLPTPEVIYSKARQRIPNQDARLPGYVQALLILGLFKMDQEDLVTSWHLIGQAVRICLHLGTAPSTSNDSNAADVDDDDHKRLLLSCFLLDTLISCRLPLNRWYDGLPKHCQISPLGGKGLSVTAPHLTPQLYNLHLAFASTDMHLRSHLAATNGIPSTQTTGLAGLSMGYLMAAFVKEFGVAQMPAIFKIYQDLGGRRVFRPVWQDRSVGSVVSVLSSEPSPNLLPTPPELTESVSTIASRTNLVPVTSLPCEAEDSITKTDALTSDAVPEYDMETWSKIFGTAELSEAGISIQQDTEGLDYLNGMAW